MGALGAQPGTLRARRRRRLAATAGAAALALGASAAVPAAAPTGARPAEASAPVPSAPVLSARRAPQLLGELVADARLRARLAGATSARVVGAPAQWCLQVSRAGLVAAAHGADAPLAPASNLKLAVADAVLATVPASTRLATVLQAHAPPAGGVVDGPLWVVGGGDPLLETADYAAGAVFRPHVHDPFEAVADAVVGAGVHEVRGGVVGDGRVFDTVALAPTWDPAYVTQGDVGPVGGLMVNDGFTTYGARFVAAPDPAAAAAALLTRLLVARGVRVDGAPSAGAAPAGAVTIASVPSMTVPAMVGEMLTDSDNDTAEALTKYLGRVRSGVGSTAAGVAAVRHVLDSQGLPTAGLRMVDGSGLDTGDRATCALLAGILARSGPPGPDPASLSAMLPVEAQSGTLARDGRATPAAGRVRAKTGTLSGVTALSGFVAEATGPPLLFSFVANGLAGDHSGTRGDLLSQQVALALSSWPDAPPAEDLAVRGPP